MFTCEVACLRATLLIACKPEQFFWWLWYAQQPAADHTYTRSPPHIQTAHDIALGVSRSVMLLPPGLGLYILHQRQHLKGNIWKAGFTGQPHPAVHPFHEGLSIIFLQVCLYCPDSLLLCLQMTAVKMKRSRHVAQQPQLCWSGKTK